MSDSKPSQHPEVDATLSLYELYRVAEELRDCAITHDGDSRLLGNVTAQHIAEVSQALVEFIEANFGTPPPEPPPVNLKEVN